MARMIKMKGLLSFRQTEPDPRTREQTGSNKIAEANKNGKPEKTPFQRAKSGAGDIFLASEAVPTVRAVN